MELANLNSAPDGKQSFLKMGDKTRSMAVVAAAAAVTKAVSSLTNMTDDEANQVVNREAIESAVDDRGIEAVTDPDVLRSAINQEELDLDDDELQAAVQNHLSKQRDR